MDHAAYDNLVFKSLGKFKQIRIWADLNGCLQGLLDVFQAFPDVPYVPHKLLFAKTLSQCLSPALPAGIQTKTLEVYQQVFLRAGGPRICKDFHIWSPGLFMFFHNAGLAQRAICLKLFNEFFIDLIAEHQRILPPLVLAILPGLLDEGTDVQSLTNAMLLNLHSHIPKMIFWRSMFKAAYFHPNTRAAFTLYSVKCDASDIMSIDHDELMEKTFNTLFLDSNPLIIRGTLDLFSVLYSFMNGEHKKRLAINCINLLNHEDQSIKRRVFAWIGNYQDDSTQAFISSSISSIINAYQKGGVYKSVVISILPIIIKREDFTIDLAKNINELDLYPCILNENMALLKLLPINIADDELRFSLSISILRNLLNSNEMDSVEKWSQIAISLIDKYDNRLKDQINDVSQKLTMFFSGSNIVLSLIKALIVLYSIEIDYSFILKNGLSNHSIAFLIEFSNENLLSHLELQNNLKICLEFLWNELKNNLDSKIVDLFWYLFLINPSECSIFLNVNWDQSIIGCLIECSKTIPFCIFQIVFNKLNSPTCINEDKDLFRKLTGYSNKIISTILKEINNNDDSYTNNVYKVSEFIVDYPYSLFILSASDDSLLSLILFLIEQKDSIRLLRTIFVHCYNFAFMTKIGGVILERVYNDKKSYNIAQLLTYINPNYLRIEDMINKVTDFPVLLQPILHFLEKSPCSVPHSKQIKLLIIKLNLLLSSNPKEPGYYVIGKSLSKLVLECSVNEIVELRESSKQSGFLKLISSYESISNDNSVAMLTIPRIPDYQSLYCVIIGKELRMLIESVFLNSSNEENHISLCSIFFSSLLEKYFLIVFYSVSLNTELQQMNIIRYLVNGYNSDQISMYLKSLIGVLSFYDSFDITSLCNFICIMVDIDFSAVISSLDNLFSQITMPPEFTLDLLTKCMIKDQNNMCKKFLPNFQSALNDVKNNSIVLMKVFENICQCTPGSILSLYNSNHFPQSLVKMTVQIDHNSIIFLEFVEKFCIIEADGFSWSDLLISTMSNSNIFSLEDPILKQFSNTIKSVCRYSNRFVSQFFESLSSSTIEVISKCKKDMMPLMRLICLTYVIYSCEFDAFSQKIQFINSYLVQALSIEEYEDIVFQCFSVFMKTLILRTSCKSIESFSPILVHELIVALNSGNETIKNESEHLIHFVMEFASSVFLFEEIAFMPDSIVFNETSSINEFHWPMIKNPCESFSLINRTTNTESIEEQVFTNICIVAKSIIEFGV